VVSSGLQDNYFALRMRQHFRQQRTGNAHNSVHRENAGVLRQAWYMLKLSVPSICHHLSELFSPCVVFALGPMHCIGGIHRIASETLMEHSSSKGLHSLLLQHWMHLLVLLLPVVVLWLPPPPLLLLLPSNRWSAQACKRVAGPCSGGSAALAAAHATGQVMSVQGCYRDIR